jgi:hypothetical protein
MEIPKRGRGRPRKPLSELALKGTLRPHRHAARIAEELGQQIAPGAVDTPVSPLLLAGAYPPHWQTTMHEDNLDLYRAAWDELAGQYPHVTDRIRLESAAMLLTEKRHADDFTRAEERQLDRFLDSFAKTATAATAAPKANASTLSLIPASMRPAGGGADRVALLLASLFPPMNGAATWDEAGWTLDDVRRRLHVDLQLRGETTEAQVDILEAMVSEQLENTPSVSV